jgi:hypothetical protein
LLPLPPGSGPYRKADGGAAGLMFPSISARWAGTAWGLAVEVPAAAGQPEVALPVAEVRLSATQPLEEPPLAEPSVAAAQGEPLAAGAAGPSGVAEPCAAAEQPDGAEAPSAAGPAGEPAAPAVTALAVGPAVPDVSRQADATACPTAAASWHRGRDHGHPIHDDRDPVPYGRVRQHRCDRHSEQQDPPDVSVA